VRPTVFELLYFVLDKLAETDMPAALLSLLFQMRFIGQEGLRPVLERCSCCQQSLEQIGQHHFCIDVKQGGIVCGACPIPNGTQIQLGKGTIKQLMWMADGELARALRVRFSPHSLAEALAFLEAFVPYHIGRMPKSLGFLRQIRHR